MNCDHAPSLSRSLQALLSSRLEKLFHVSFPQTTVPLLEEEVMSLQDLLEPPEEKPQPGTEEEKSWSSSW